jgi:hypothetical protein
MNRRKQDKLRRKARKEREARRQQAPSAYLGSKYHTDELAPVYLEVETAIYASYLVSGGRTTDHDVRRGLEKLILSIRQGLPVVPGEEPELVYAPGDEAEFVVTSIRRQCWDKFRFQGDPGRDNLVGVLRSTLGSISRYASVSPQSRNYLEFLEEFLADLGIHMHVERELPDESTRSRLESEAM